MRSSSFNVKEFVNSLLFASIILISGVILICGMCFLVFLFLLGSVVLVIREAWFSFFKKVMIEGTVEAILQRRRSLDSTVRIRLPDGSSLIFDNIGFHIGETVEMARRGRMYQIDRNGRSLREFS